ncbi:MAG: GAF and HD-GYP domain-containing protein [Thermoleophilaceae bacterium]
MGEGYGGLVLARLAAHTCRAIGVEGAWVFASENGHVDRLIAVAAEGAGRALVGTSFQVEEGVLRKTLASGNPMLIEAFSTLGVPAAHAGDWTIAAGGAAPVRWRGRVRGLIAAGSAEGGRAFGRRELDTLSELAELAAPALEHAEEGRHLGDATLARVEALSAALELRDGYTFRHSHEVVAIARRVGQALDVSGPDLVELEFAARLHDVGKLAVDDAVLRKPEPLEGGEWALVRRHAEWGASKLAEIPGLEPTAAIVRFHHERWDGGGYPDGLVGEQIPLASRIVAACDAYRAMVEDRPYRAALSHEDALAELEAGSGSQFDPDVVDALLAVLQADA